MAAIRKVKSSLLCLLFFTSSAFAQPLALALTNMVPHIVVPRTNYSVTLAWNAVSNAASYRVYLGTNSGSYVQSSDSTITRTSFTNLPSGTYYAAPTCFNAQGIESDYGQELKFGLPFSNTILSVVAADCASAVEGPWAAITNVEIFRSTNATGNQFFKLRIEKSYY